MESINKILKPISFVTSQQEVSIIEDDYDSDDDGSKYLLLPL